MKDKNSKKVPPTTSNTFVDGRIVNDITFATRLKSLLSEIKTSDLAGQEEVEYLNHVADKLIIVQIQTASEKNERAYLARVHQNDVKNRAYTRCPSCQDSEIYFEGHWTCKACTYDWGS